MKDIIKDKWVDILIVGGISLAISYGISDWIDIGKGLALCTPLVAIICFFIGEKFNKKSKNTETEELVRILDETVKEQTEILDEYERIFDAQLVKLPCVCGKNTFQGLFTPNTENIVECEMCDNKYRVDITYDAVMISEPLDVNQTFDDLVKKSV